MRVVDATCETAELTEGNAVQISWAIFSICVDRVLLLRCVDRPVARPCGASCFHFWTFRLRAALEGEEGRGQGREEAGDGGKKSAIFCRAACCFISVVLSFFAVLRFGSESDFKPSSPLPRPTWT